MTRVFGFVGLLIVLVIGWMIYQREIKAVSSPGVEGAQGTPRATIDLAGVKNDLIALGNAERRSMASSGKYKSLEELRSNGDVSMTSNTRGPYTYSADIGESTFRITATRGGAEAGGPAVISIDETMAIKQE